MKQRIFLLFFFVFCALVLNAQQLRKNIKFIPEKTAKEGYIRIQSFTNSTDKDVLLKFDNSDQKSIQVNRKKTVKCDVTVKHIKAIVLPKSEGIEEVIWSKEQFKRNFGAEEPVEERKTDILPVKEEVQDEIQESTPSDNRNDLSSETSNSRKSSIDVQFIYKQICSELNLTLGSISLLQEQCNNHILNLSNWEDKNAYIQTYKLKEFVDNELVTLDNASNKKYKVIKQYSDKGLLDDSNVYEIENIVNLRIQKKEELLNKLSQKISDVIIIAKQKEVNETSNMQDLSWKSIIIYLLNFIVLLLIIVFTIKVIKKNRSQKNSRRSNNNGAKNVDIKKDGQPGLVVRRTTTTILKTQNLDDVVDNLNYFKIDCADFCNDSAVRRIYVKNTCIKEIYEMYAEDLRNPNNPKEDGCMVLGRWVKDSETNEYYVSLEQVVLPGDDAVFDEYALNFGAKIKLKIAEQLRRLRRQTNLQYDLTCWVHSHPGLGVFFSNADSNVHLQMKHPTHPLFLTAFVVDILTPNQEMGIFTFKKDGTINSGSDLTKMYSLDDMYQWALKSDRENLLTGDLYDILGKSRRKLNCCSEVLLTNGSIIDMEKIVMLQKNGSIAFVHGYKTEDTKYVVSTINNEEFSSSNDLIGCFLIESYCSIPSVRKILSEYLHKSNFIIIFSTSDNLLTTIPIENGEIRTDLDYYSEEQYIDLKAWTRRKR